MDRTCNCHIGLTHNRRGLFSFKVFYAFERRELAPTAKSRDLEIPPTEELNVPNNRQLRTDNYFKVFWSLPLLVFLLSCASTPKEEPFTWKVTFFSLGAKAQLNEEAPVQRLNAFNADGVMVARLNFPTPPRQTEPLYFEWREGETYTFEATLTTGDVDIQTVTAPRTYTQGSLEIAIPYGVGRQPESENTANNNQVALVLHDSEMTATVLVRNGKIPATFALELCLPSTLTVVRLPAGWQTEMTDAGTCLSTTGRFRVASEVWYRELALKTSTTTDSERQEISGVVRFTADTGQTWEQQTTVELRGATVPEITQYLSIASIKMPTDATGAVDSKQREDTIYYPRPLFSWLDTSPTNPFEPTTYQTIRLHNQGEETIHVAVSSINRDIKTGEVVPFLTPPETANGGTNQSVAFASLPGDEVTEIPLPIYFHPTYLKAGKIEQAIPGEYTRDIAVKVWGSDATILREERPLHLIVPNQQALLVSLLAIISSTIGLAVVLKLHKQLFAGFTTKQLIVIALFGTTVFVAVTVPSTLFLNLIRALLGPISVLLTGLINETLYYALLTALLIYISGDPENARRGDQNRHSKGSGVILLVSAVRLLLGGVTFGLFTPMAIVYTGTSVLLLETGFLFVRRRSLFVWAVVLGLCDAIAVYVNLQLAILLYRLFYADWYIILRILIEGFVYTFIGVLLGARLGRGLWRVAD